MLIDSSAVSKAIDKLVALADAGADCLYAPGVRKKEDIATMVKAVAPKPLNVLAMGPGLTLSAFTDLGVRHVSVDGALALVSWNAMRDTSQKLQADRLTVLLQKQRAGSSTISSHRELCLNPR